MTNPTQRKSVSILGATGSVGCNTLDLISQYRDSYRVVALTAGKNADLLIDQAKQFEPEFVAIADPGQYSKVASELSGQGIEVAAGPEAILEAARRDAEWVMAGIVGAAGLAPTLEAVRRGATIALANKECLVCSGDLFMSEVESHGATLLPVDSEHNAIFQVLEHDRMDAVEKIILTSSGGPFRGLRFADMALKTREEALAHPNFKMGAKISVDSATMMNKGLEIIEAHYLFNLPSERIEVLVHPQQTIHSMVAYHDGSVLAQLGTPDMRIPIAHALAWPERMATSTERLDLVQIGTMTFEPPNPEAFPALRLAREALDAGQEQSATLNAANEVAVAAFLGGTIRFGDITAVVEEVVDTRPGTFASDLAAILEIDRETRGRAEEVIARIQGPDRVGKAASA